MTTEILSERALRICSQLCPMSPEYFQTGGIQITLSQDTAHPKAKGHCSCWSYLPPLFLGPGKMKFQSIVNFKLYPTFCGRIRM